MATCAQKCFFSLSLSVPAIEKRGARRERRRTDRESFTNMCSSNITDGGGSETGRGGRRKSTLVVLRDVCVQQSPYVEEGSSSSLRPIHAAAARGRRQCMGEKRQGSESSVRSFLWPPLLPVLFLWRGRAAPLDPSSVRPSCVSVEEEVVVLVVDAQQAVRVALLRPPSPPPPPTAWMADGDTHTPPPVPLLTSKHTQRRRRRRRRRARGSPSPLRGVPCGGGR